MAIYVSYVSTSQTFENKPSAYAALRQTSQSHFSHVQNARLTAMRLGDPVIRCLIRLESTLQLGFTIKIINIQYRQMSLNHDTSSNIISRARSIFIHHRYC